MNEARSVVEWLTQGSPASFVLGVLALIFGTEKLLSAKNVEESLGGLALPFRWLRKRRDQAALDEAAAEVELQILRADQHKYILHLTRWVYELQIWAAGKGLVLPPPEFELFNEWREKYGYEATHHKDGRKRRKDNEDDGDEDDEDEAEKG